MSFIPFLFSVVLLVLSAWSHARGLRSAQATGDVSIKIMARRWTKHCAVNGTLWLLTLAMVTWMVITSAEIVWPVWISSTGLILAIVGSIASLLQFTVFGSAQSMGIHFFFPEETQQQESGVYRYLQNPMYDAFVLTVVGFGFFRGSFALLAFAVIMVIVLHGYLAPKENDWLEK